MPFRKTHTSIFWSDAPIIRTFKKRKKSLLEKKSVSWSDNAMVTQGKVISQSYVKENASKTHKKGGIWCMDDSPVNF